MLKNSLEWLSARTPTRCTFCLAETCYPLMICTGCKADLPWIESGCRSCGLPLPIRSQQLQCGECLSGQSPFTRAIIPLLYQKPVNRIITAFKHRRGLAQGRLLAQLLAEEIRDHYIDHELPEIIIPVPLHWQRFLWRGYNQAHELGKQLSKELLLPCDNNLLKRVRQTPSQQYLNRDDRLKNLKGAFALQKEISIKHAAILDDVVTTGSTASEIARFLQQRGVEEIHLWALARTASSM